MLGLKRGRVELAAYQDEWGESARATIEELKLLLGEAAVDIQHIGSTAVPSIHAKPIVDIVVGVRVLGESTEAVVGALECRGFVFRGEDVPGQLLFVKGDFENDVRTHHIHVVEWDGAAWKDYLAFRDYLNEFPEKARIYDDLKRELAARFATDRKRYTEGKQELIARFLEEARLA